MLDPHFLQPIGTCRASDPQWFPLGLTPHPFITWPHMNCIVSVADWMVVRMWIVFIKALHSYSSWNCTWICPVQVNVTRLFSLWVVGSSFIRIAWIRKILHYGHQMELITIVNKLASRPGSPFCFLFISGVWTPWCHTGECDLIFFCVPSFRRALRGFCATGWFLPTWRRISVHLVMLFVT